MITGPVDHGLHVILSRELNSHSNGSRLRARRYLVKRSVLINRMRDLPSSLEGLI